MIGIRLGFGHPLTPAEIRSWRESLELSEGEAGDALNLNNGNVTYREWERQRGAPAPPTVFLMDVLATVVLALIQMRLGRTADARGTLERVLTGPLNRYVENHCHATTPRAPIGGGRTLG
jgi:hypothetical protein